MDLEVKKSVGVDFHLFLSMKFTVIKDISSIEMFKINSN